MVAAVYLYSRSSIYSGAERMLLTLAQGIYSVSRNSKIHLTHSSSDFNVESEVSIYKNKIKPGLIKISEKPYFILIYFFSGLLKIFSSSVRKKNSILIFNDIESLIIYWPLALFNDSYFYLHDSHKAENIKARLICKIISLLVSNILVITESRLNILSSIGIKNLIYFPNCTLELTKEVRRMKGLRDVHCICVAQITAWKRIDKVIDLFNSLAEFNGEKKWHLHICGRPNQRDKEGLQIESDLIRLGSTDSRINYHGYVKDVNRMMGQCHLLLSMSENEPFGLALVEALQKGCYVLSAEGEGPSEIISSDLIGRIIPNNCDIESWVAINSVAIFDNIDSFFDERVNSSNRYSFESYKNRIKTIWFD
ncbi:glycosyltransferase [Vibrio cyclitrophicus]